MRPRFEHLFPGCEYDTALQVAYLSPRRFQSDAQLKSTDAQWSCVVLAMVRLLAKDYANFPVRAYVLSGDHK